MDEDPKPLTAKDVIKTVNTELDDIKKDINLYQLIIPPIILDHLTTMSDKVKKYLEEQNGVFYFIFVKKYLLAPSGRHLLQIFFAFMSLFSGKGSGRNKRY